MRVWVPIDAAARALGADEVAEAVQREMGVAPTRNGSRGMIWLEPLMELEIGGVRHGFGPVAPEDVAAIPHAPEIPKEVADHFGIKQAAPHAVVLKLVTTNICGSDQHMVRGRTAAPVGQSLGHEITGEVVEVGDDVLFVKEGDICSVPFNIACGRCRMCFEGKTGICLNVNPARAGAAYGYVDMGGWVGGQAEYVLVP